MRGFSGILGLALKPVEGVSFRDEPKRKAKGRLGMSVKTSLWKAPPHQNAYWAACRLGMCVEKKARCVLKLSFTVYTWLRICAGTREVILNNLFKRLHQSPCRPSSNEDTINVLCGIYVL